MTNSALSSALATAVARARQMPPTWRLVALGVILCTLATFWGFERGKAEGSLGERLAADRKAIGGAMATRHVVAQRVAEVTKRVERSDARAQAAHAAAIVIDATHMAVQLTPGAQATRVEVAAPIVARVLADSQALADRDSLIAVLRALARADTAVIERQSETIRDLEGAKTPRCGMKCGVVIGAGAALGILSAIVHFAR